MLKRINADKRMRKSTTFILDDMRALCHDAPMKWYFKVRGGHTHVRVFMNRGKCGDLCFRNEEFAAIRDLLILAP